MGIILRSGKGKIQKNIEKRVADERDKNRDVLGEARMSKFEKLEGDYVDKYSIHSFFIIVN
jgi:hypothetical protein